MAKAGYLACPSKGDVEMMQEINKLSRVIDFSRKQLNKDLPSQHIALLLAVAEQPGITMPELCERLDMPQGTVSRNVKLMSHYCDKNNGASVPKKGYGLLETEPAPTNRYQRAVFLTDAGERLVEKLARVMGHEQVIDSIPQRMVGNSASQRNQVLS
jgi:DNA-binding MarR family transcriptional regulator